jgi:hypothetical protein
VGVSLVLCPSVLPSLPSFLPFSLLFNQSSWWWGINLLIFLKISFWGDSTGDWTQVVVPSSQTLEPCPNPFVCISFLRNGLDNCLGWPWTLHPPSSIFWAAEITDVLHLPRIQIVFSFVCFLSCPLSSILLSFPLVFLNSFFKFVWDYFTLLFLASWGKTLAHWFQTFLFFNIRLWRHKCLSKLLKLYSQALTCCVLTITQLKIFSDFPWDFSLIYRLCRSMLLDAGDSRLQSQLLRRQRSGRSWFEVSLGK